MPRRKSNHFQMASNDEESYLAAADFFLCFSNPISLMILSIVRKKEATSGEISERLGITPKTALAGLKTMEQQGILHSRAGYRKIIYGIADPKILKAFDRIIEHPAIRRKQIGSS